jgi:Flp pilus assembly pilin Flp
MKNRILYFEARLASWMQRKFSPRDEVGASLVEYVLLVTLIAVAAIGALVALSGSITGTLNKVTKDINDSITTTSAG